jgi:putative AlgH/UPF0301 family transcriptional regulator
MLAFALLASGTILAALHAKGLRLVMRFDDVGGSPFGFAVVRHGAPVPGLGPGTLLVANSGLNHSIFKRSVVLIYQHGGDGDGGGGGSGGGGARGVILTQPMSSYSSSSSSSPSSFSGSGNIDVAEEEESRGNGENRKQAIYMHKINNKNKDNEDQKDGEIEGEGELASLLTKAIDPNTVSTVSSASTQRDEVVQHRLGGPVGMPGEGARQEITVVHSVPGIEGASLVLLGDGSIPSVYIGGMLTDVLERGKKTLCNDVESRSRSKVERKKNDENGKDEDERKSGGGDGSSGNTNTEEYKSDGLACEDGPREILVFHGIATWTEGQLEGEIRAGAWAYGDATYDDVMKASPGELWRSLVRSDRVGMLM